MAGFALTEDQLALVREVRQVATSSSCRWRRRARPARVNRPLLAAMGRHDLLARMFAATAPGTRSPRRRCGCVCCARRSRP